MKKIIWIVIILVLIGLGFWIYKGSSSQAPASSNDNSATGQTTFVPSTQTDATLLARLESASVSVSEDGTSENLVNGSANTVSLYSSNGNMVNAEKSVNGRKDVLAVVIVKTGGKNSDYLILFNDTGTTLTQKSIAYLGDSLTIQNLTLTDIGASSGEDYVATVISKTSAGQSLTSILPVKNGAFDTANSLSL